jgi:apolipoprotein D and lipocalin family protein
MKKLFTFLLPAFLTLPSFAIETVPHVDLGQYLGRWYEIASIPAKFQKKCVKNTTAEYRKLDFGKIDVINSCSKADGSQEVANGIASVVNRSTQAELKVSFVPFFNHFGWFAGQYKVLALGENYEYSLVGEDSMKYGWILARQPALSAPTLISLEQKIRFVGYDSCKFLVSIQDQGIFTQREPLCEVIKRL